MSVKNILKKRFPFIVRVKAAWVEWRFNHRSRHAYAIYRWNRNQCKNRLWDEQSLDSDSVVFDLGGYVGDWTAKMLEKNPNSQYYIFEPVHSFYEGLIDRFRKLENVRVFCLGLEDQSSSQIIKLDADASSIYPNNKGKDCKTEEIQFVCMHDFLLENGISRISLMKVNIEGGEYNLLEHVLQTGDIKKIQHIVIQFHNIPNIQSYKRMKEIRRRLRKTHRIEWAYYPFVWDKWNLRRKYL
ncbi:hypothetical protein SDC9_115463 [bioreactor metagenome]|uniref:Methyltransferase FkbM domain-containing protein n=1 Tax=bioreactor metagenome TaxID=1076179 RepID=A0A645BSX7_9ZZZZ